MRRRVAVLPLLMAAGMMGCELRITEPFSGEPADLLASLSVEENGATRWVLSASLRPGRKESGTLRGVEDLTLRVGEQTILPFGLGHHGLRRYAASWTGAGGTASLSLRPPGVEGASAGLEWLTFGGCEDDPAPSVPLLPSDTLRMAVRCVLDDAALRHVEWSLEVRRADAGGLVASLGAVAPPPHTIELPAGWLIQPGDPPMELRLTVTRRLVWNDGAGEDYRVGLELRWSFVRPLTWASGEGSAGEGV